MKPQSADITRGALLVALIILGLGAPALPGAPAGQTSAAGSNAVEPQQGDSAKQSAAQGNSQNGKSQPPAGENVKRSAGIDEILKMAQAGVSAEVMKDFIENSNIPFNPSADEIIALKTQSVPDEVTRAMIKRGATLRPPANHQSKPPAYSGGGPNRAMLDPDSYEYFQYYYLYPRTLAAANQRLYSYYPSYPGYSPYYYGYYGPAPFSPFSPSAFRHP